MKEYMHKKLSNLGNILSAFRWRWLIMLCLFSLTSISYAESCKMVGGCIGNVWYVHIPKSQFNSRKIFTKVGLPKVNDIEILSTDLSLLQSNTFFDKPFLQDIQRDLKMAVEKDDVLSHWGWRLEAGEKIKILSYQTFPALGDMGNELFALVLVISE